MFRCFTKDELRINRCILTISNLTNELSLNYTINNRFVVLLGMNHTYFINIKGSKNALLRIQQHINFTLTQSTLTLNYIFYLLSIYTLAYLHFLSSVNLHLPLSTFFIFYQFTLSLIYVFIFCQFTLALNYISYLLSIYTRA